MNRSESGDIMKIINIQGYPLQKMELSDNDIIIFRYDSYKCKPEDVCEVFSCLRNEFPKHQVIGLPMIFDFDIISKQEAINFLAKTICEINKKEERKGEENELLFND